MSNQQQNPNLYPIRHADNNQRLDSLNRLRQLTDQEYHVALMLYNHRSNRDIAAEMHMRHMEVYNLRFKIYEKLGVEDLVGLVKYLCKLDVEYLSYDDLRG